jgi:hypothetical protein
MEQATTPAAMMISATWAELLAGAAAVAIIIVGGVWAVVGLKWTECISQSTV